MKLVINSSGLEVHGGNLPAFGKALEAFRAECRKYEKPEPVKMDRTTEEIKRLIQIR